MGKVRKEDEQKTLVFDWTERDVILREAKLPPLTTKHGATVSIEKAQLILYKIYSRAGGKNRAWPSIEQLRQDCGGRMSERTVRRAVEALNRIGVLCIERESVKVLGEYRTMNVYTIAWGDLALLCDNPTIRRRLNETEAIGHFEPDRSDILNPTDRTRVSAQAMVEATKKPPPPTPRPKPPKQVDPWRKVEEDFRAHVGAVSRLVRKFRSDGKSPDELRGILDEGLATVGIPANAGKFKSPAGAVFAWVDNGVWPAADVISIGQERDRLAQVARMNEMREKAQAADANRLEAFEAKLEALEAEHGETLDAMTGREQAALLDNQLASALIRRGKAETIRPQLLEALASRASTAG